MKILFILLCLLCVLLAGCGPQKKSDAPMPTEELVETAELLPEEIDEIIADQIEESAAAPEETAADEAEAERAAALAALLEDVRTSVFPGTAGSSLSAAAHAAAIADFFCESGMSPDEADRAARAYMSSLSAEDAQLFEQQFDSVVSAFSSLRGENGAGLLEDCGYESAYFPWDAENAQSCFVALLGTD